MALILVLPVCASAPARSAGTAGAALLDQMMQAKCTRPDSKLIKPGTADKYNAQAKGFNDCLRVYVEMENNKIAQIRSQASGEIDKVTDSAISQFRDIERAITAAIIEVKIVNGEASAADLPPSAATLAAFPAAECPKPNEALLKPAKGKRAPSLQATDRYEQQRLGHEACMRLYVAQAKNQIAQVKANAEMEFKRIADDANPRIAQINSEVTEALNEARKASGERVAAMNAVHSPLSAGGLSPAAFQPGGTRSIGSAQPGTESVTVTGERLPRSADMPTGVGDPDAISCRKPQILPDSRLLGPEICKRNRDWAKLYKEGRNISSDGTRILEAEKARTYNPVKCATAPPVVGMPSPGFSCINGL
jgi:hypothetical protein